MLKFNAVKYQNNRSTFSVVEDSLPVKVENGKYLLPSEDEILVKVHAAALNPFDMIIKNSLPAWLFKADKGLGVDYSGEVVAIGSGAASSSGFSVQDRISGMYQTFLGAGTVSEYILINPKTTGANSRKVPASLSYQEAAAYPLVFGTAQTMFDSVHRENSFKKVLILGSGTSVGRFCVQLASKVYGSKEIVVTCSGRTEETVRDLGATSVIDYTKQKSILNAVLASVQESGPFDVILDCCGNSDLFPEIQSIIKSRKDFGSYVTAVGDNKSNFQTGTLASFMLGNLSTGPRLVKNLLGFLPYYYSQAFLDANGSWPDKCIKSLEEANMKVFIDSEYAMVDIQKAVDRVQSNKAVGKVIVNIV